MGKEIDMSAKYIVISLLEKNGSKLLVKVTIIHNRSSRQFERLFYRYRMNIESRYTVA